jgi:hypothetical protein
MYNNQGISGDSTKTTTILQTTYTKKLQNGDPVKNTSNAEMGVSIMMLYACPSVSNITLNTRIVLHV